MRSNKRALTIDLTIVAGLFAALCIFFSACQTPEVASNRSIQKRKYRDGYYVRHADQKQGLRQHRGHDIPERIRLLGKDIPETPSALRHAESAPRLQQEKKKAANPTAQQPLKKNSGGVVNTKQKHLHERSVRPGKATPEQSAPNRRGVFGVIGFIITLVGLVIPAAAPPGLILCAIDLKPDVGRALTITGLVLGILEVIGWSLLTAFLFTAGFVAWAWVILALLVIGIAFVIAVAAGAFE